MDAAVEREKSIAMAGGDLRIAKMLLEAKAEVLREVRMFDNFAADQFYLEQEARALGHQLDPATGMDGYRFFGAPDTVETKA